MTLKKKHQPFFHVAPFSRTSCDSASNLLDLVSKKEAMTICWTTSWKKPHLKKLMEKGDLLGGTNIYL